MKYYSLHHKAAKVSFKDAVIKGIAPDKGLYFPEKITPLTPSFFKSFTTLSEIEIAYKAIASFVGNDIPNSVLQEIVTDTLSFPFPIRTLNNSCSILELFHGPTMAFKDVGARFMARCLGYFTSKKEGKITVLVATSGDTGGAVASGFLGVKGVEVVLLYPSGKVSEIQEKQLTTLGQNITALEVNGVFDDCQDMVKQAFLDTQITSQMQLTSANSINVARWLPQLFYFLFAYKQLYKNFKTISFSVPSGNFGNICAGMVAQKLGLPVHQFIAANNANNSVTRFLETKTFTVKKTIPTISNAMDVGNPSNFVRIQELYSNNFTQLSKHLSSYSFSDKATKNAMLELYQNFNYIADPHGAVGFLGAKEYLKVNPASHVVVLETAHPAKFLDTVETVIPEKIILPKQLKAVIKQEKVATKITAYTDLKEFLLQQK